MTIRRYPSSGSTGRPRSAEQRSTPGSGATGRRSKRVVLGVDLGLGTTGLAVVKGKKVTKAEAVHPPGPQKACLEERLELILNRTLYLAAGVDLTVIEGPAYSRPNAAIAMGQLSGVVRLALWQRQHPFVIVGPRTVKLHATGSGNASKDQMVEAARVLYDTTDHNVADAILLARYGEDKYDELVEEG